MAGLEERIRDKIKEISKTADEYPGAVVIQNIQELKIVYMCDRALKALQISWAEVQNLNMEEYHKRYFNPEDAKEYSPKIQAMLSHKDTNQMISFFQQVRTAENKEWEWYLTSMKVLMVDDEQKPLLAISYAIPIDPKNHITNKVNRLLEENTFLREHHEKFYSLGKREKEVLRYIASGKSSTEIANTLNISEMTVATHRKNIKRKLDIKSPFDLQQYGRAFDLI